MSWSIHASGTPAEVRVQLGEQFKHPLAEKPAGLDDDGERETVRLISELLEQATTTFDPAHKLAVAAYGHMSMADYTTKAGAAQSVSFTITPLG
jgi:hypothetical protein